MPWRAGLRIREALALAEHELDPRRGSLLVRNGKGGRHREVGMDEWAGEHLRPWLSARAQLQRQLGHANLGTTSIYVQAIDLEEIITAVRSRSAPMMLASAGLRL